MMTAKEILKKIEEIRMNGACFGIRCTDETHEIGDELENSYNWNEFDEEHDGEDQRHPEKEAAVRCDERHTL